jgi:hypothetical protein
MANPNALTYGHWSDNVAPNATITVQTGTAATGYAAANIADRNPAKPSKLNETTGAWQFSFAAAQRVDAVFLPMHNLIAGLNVRIQANATAAWGAPTFDQPIVIPTYREDGFPVGSWLDLTPLAGYSAVGFQHWRLVVVGVNSAAVAVGEFGMVRVKRVLDPNISWGTVASEERQIIEHQTDFGVSTIYDLGVTKRRLAGDVDATDASVAAIRSWWRDARGRANPFYIAPDATVNDGMLVRFQDTKLEVQLEQVDRNSLQIGFEELARGLFL